MSRTKYIAGNWKMHKTIDEAGALAAGVVRDLQGAGGVPQGDVRVVVIPPFTALHRVRDELSNSGIALGAQNVGVTDEGAHTGEISGAMLVDAGVEYAVVGHSERRHVYGETDELIAQRVRGGIAGGVRVILCVGETLNERESGNAVEVCVHQLLSGLEGVSDAEMARIVVAYEPVWAIGTGKTATPGDAGAMHEALREAVGRQWGGGVAAGTSILYGGSVKPANSAELFAQEHIDGALVGGAALHVDDFCSIIKSIL